MKIMNVYLDDKVFEKLTKQAEKENRSKKQMAELLIERGLQ